MRLMPAIGGVHLLLIPIMAALCACDRQAPGAPPPAPVESHFLLPGDYAQATTVAELQSRFGEDNVRIVDAPERALMLFPDDPARRARVRFHDPGQLEELASIRVTDPGSRWRGKHGVRIGMSLKELRALNGKPFSFYTAVDGSSALVHDSWSPALNDEDASLGRFDVDEGEHAYFEVDVAARDPVAMPKPFPPEEQLSSDDPRLAAMGETLVVTGFAGTTSLDDEWD